MQNFFKQTPCLSLTRSLYTTNLPDSQKVITSVAVVRMDTAANAQAFRRVSDESGTGHIKDLVEEGAVIPGGPKELQDAGYYSVVRGNRVVIVMTEFVDVTLDTNANLGNPTNNHTLRGVSQDAAKQRIGES
jgi:hypothetical protein